MKEICFSPWGSAVIGIVVFLLPVMGSSILQEQLLEQRSKVHLGLALGVSLELLIYDS